MDRRQYQPVVDVGGTSPNDRFVPEIRVLDVFVSALGTEPRRLARLQALSSLVSDLRPEVIHSYSLYTNIIARWVARDTAAIPIEAVQRSFISERRHKTLLRKLSAR